MKLVKVDATTSTNETAKTIYKKGFKENFCISSEYQSSGKGQHDKSWHSERSKNLTFTVVLTDLKLNIDNRFFLNILVCKALIDVLKTYQLDHLLVKWPNDILSEQKKICGVLIENTISSSLITTSYIGIGLNVNQEVFPNLPKASSMKLLLGRELDRETLLNLLLKKLEKLPLMLNTKNSTAIITSYKQLLYGYSTYTYFIKDGKTIRGTIIGLDTTGRIKIQFETGNVMSLTHSEIRQVF